MATQFDRRQWLRTAGLAGAFSILGGANALASEQSTLRVIANNAKAPKTPIRLSSNENPYGPSDKVKQAIIDGFDEACRYPYALARELGELIAKKHGVPTDHVVLTGGSTEGLKAVGLTYGLHGGEIVAAQPTFLALMDYAEQFGAYVHYVPLDDNMVHDLDAMERRITNNTRLVFVCNPNNPTGTIVSASKMKDFCASISKQAVVFSDEAYFDYITEPNYPSMIELVKQGMNVIVSRTFSKVYGMAGIRVGYMIARPDIARRLQENTMAGVSIPAIVGAKAALEDTEFYKFSLQKNMECKNIMYKTLDELKMKYVKSHANFAFFYTGKEVSEMNKMMADKGIFVGRPFPPLTKWLRVSTGKVEEVEAFVKALKEVV
ncbi:MAG: histidinol-phosphate aminotransferase family protein [Saprospiraceae bacterium]|nr:histidinol-phosphate aminotransferase family protein [Saprospiraceae bacterium]